MTTNAQAALAAAATLTAQTRGTVRVGDVTAIADSFVTWLDSKDRESADPRAMPSDEPANYVGTIRNAPPGKVMHPRRCIDADGAHLCTYPEPHRHGVACSKECECNTGDELVREYLLDGDAVGGVERPRPATFPKPGAEPEQDEREVDMGALIEHGETTGADELHADKRPDSYGDRGEDRRHVGGKLGNIGFAPSVAHDPAVFPQAQSRRLGFYR